MPKLSHRDMLALLDSINTLHSDISWETLPDRTLRAVLSLIPNEMTVFDGFDTDGEYGGYYWYSPPGTISEEWVTRLVELIHEHPVYEEIVLPQKEATFRTSEFLSLREFHRTAIYNEVYRHIGGEAQMATTMRVSPTCFVTNSIYRLKVDFSERELEMFRLLSPHLKTAFQNSREFENVVKARNGLSKVAKKGIVILDTDRTIIFFSDLAVQLLAKFFPKFERDELPEELQRYVNEQNLRVIGQEYFEPADTMRVRLENSELEVRLAFDLAGRELTLFLEEKNELVLDDLSPLGLTKRETEIVFWLLRGKADAVIGELCGISVRTVEKHVENIFKKLGVESRTAAAMAALGKIGR